MLLKKRTDATNENMVKKAEIVIEVKLKSWLKSDARNPSRMPESGFI
jgi:cytidylate kinase